MIREIKINNFRCFASAELNEIPRLNIIVGDNGSGKTSILEAIFLALGSSTEIALRLRQQRGLDGTFTGSPRQIEAAIFNDLFFERDLSNSISVLLSGDKVHNRSVTIAKSTGQTILPLSDLNDVPGLGNIRQVPFRFTWRDYLGVERSIQPRATLAGVELPETGENLQDSFLFPAQSQVSSVETASRFSELSKNGDQSKFVEIFTREYPWIKNISIEVSAGAPILYADLGPLRGKWPLANISSGVHRMASVMLAIASQSQSVILVDEIENGIFYAHQVSMWKSILSFVRAYDTQLFVTTHSYEWLKALVKAAGQKMDDIMLWRVERGERQPEIFSFSGDMLRSGIEYKTEVRGRL